MTVSATPDAFDDAKDNALPEGISDAIISGALTSLNLGVLTAGPDRRITYCNAAFERITGFTLAEITGETAAFLQGPLTDPEDADSIREVLRTGKEYRGKILNYRKNGNTFWNDLTITPRIDMDGEVIGYLAIIVDVTEATEKNVEFNRLKEEYRQVFDNASCGIVLHNLDTTIIKANPIACRMLHINPLDFSRRYDNEHWRFLDTDMEEYDEEQLPVPLAIRTGKPVFKKVVGTIDPVTEKVSWLSCDAFPICGNNGRIKHILTTFNDITESFEKEREAALFRERFERAAEASDDIVYDWDLQTWELWVNSRYEARYGNLPDPVVPIDKFRPPHVSSEGAKRFQRAITRAIEDGSESLSTEYEYKRSDGRKGYAFAKGIFLRDEDGRALRLIGRNSDVTRFRSAVNAAQQSEARFRLISTLLSDVIFDIGILDGVSWFTPGWSTRLNLNVDDSESGLASWAERIHPEDRFAIIYSFQKAIRTCQESWEAEFRVVDDDGHVILLSAKAALVTGDHGQVERVIGSLQDITGIKGRQEEVFRARTLGAVGRLTGGVAHDFNNLLMIILGNAEMLEMGKLDADDKESVELIRKAAESGAALTSRLLSFAGGKRLAPKVILPAAFWEEASHLLYSGIAETIRITNDIPTDTWPIEVDPVELEHTLLNLAVNSADAMPDGGTLHIEFKNRNVCGDCEECDEDNIELAKGEYVRISISDSGHGIPEEVINMVLEPFFSTKQHGKGTGLGLSAAYGFAKNSGGILKIESQIDEGTTIKLFFPRAKKDIKPEAKAMRYEHAEASGERILVVEDQPDVRRQVNRQLVALGYEVVVAGDGSEALEILEDDSEFDLVFSDVIMPGGYDGVQLSAAIHALYPGLRVLLTSGYPDKALKNLTDGERSSLTFLKKPYRFSALSDAIQTALGEELEEAPTNG
ncbi:MAG: PAS domain-containing protein [Pseudomonadota bacterium]|nr:PAS domain-containing protein [Pseudomonadota bacterium]